MNSKTHLTVTITSWEKYQSQSDKKKTWIKLHDSILRSPEIMDGLTAADRWVFLGLLLLAKDRDGEVSGSMKLLASSIQVRPTFLKKTILQCENLGLISTKSDHKCSSSCPVECQLSTKSDEKKIELDLNSNKSNDKNSSSVPVETSSVASASQEVPAKVTLEKKENREEKKEK